MSTEDLYIGNANQLNSAKSCNLCGSDKSAVVIDGRYGIVARCNSCGLMFRKTVKGRYPIECYGGAEHHAQQVGDKQVLQLADYERALPIVETYIKRNGSPPEMLDIGSYYGEFLALAKSRGYGVTGLEPDAGLAAQSRKRHRDIPVVSALLKEAQFKDDSFDVVTLFHVIEHMDNPLDELGEIRRILKPGGMAVIETPRYDTIWFRVLKERERSVIPEHYYFFTKATLKSMATKAGMSVARLDSVGRTLTADRLLGNVCKVLSSARAAKSVNHLSEILKLSRVRFHVNTGDMMRLYALK